jgi:hypothetical protein
MVKIFVSMSQYSSKRRDYEQFSGLEGCRNNSLAEFGQVVFVCPPDFLDKAMRTKAFDHASYLVRRFADKMFSESVVRQAADVEFAPHNGLEQIEIIAVKQIEAAATAAVFAGGLRDFLNVFLCRAGVVNRGDKVDIAAICGPHQFGKHIQTVDVFLQRCKLHFACAVTMFHPAVVFKKGNVIDCRFDTQHQAVFIVHFDRHRPHVVFNACSLDAGTEVITHLVFIIGVKIPPQEGGDIVGLDGMDGRSDQFAIDGRKIALSFENNVRGVFGLHNAPVIAVLKMADHRTVQTGILIQYPVNAFYMEVVGQFLRPVKVVDVDKAIVEHGRRNALVGQLSRQLVMAVEIELETKRRPGWHTQVTEAKVSVDKIKVVVQAFAAVAFEICFAGLFVVPGLVAGTRFHGREDMDKAGLRAAFSDNLLDALLLAKILFADKINGKVILGSNLFGVFPEVLPERHCPLGIVEYADILQLQKQRHSVGITNAGNRTRQYDAVKTRNNAFDFTPMSLNKIRHARSFQYNHVGLLSEKCRAA